MKYLITTPCGQIQGTKGNIEGVVAYKGIRYATASRFEYPKQVTSWEGIYDATKYGNLTSIFSGAQIFKNKQSSL